MMITVINGKRTFNRSDIMHTAWVIFKVEGKSFPESLKAAWAKAKSAMNAIKSEENKESSQSEKLNQYKVMVRTAEGDEDKIEEILDKAMDELDSKYFARLQDFAFDMF